MISVVRYRWFMIEAATSRTETRARIVDAAARLLQNDGPAAVTTRGVAQRAGVQAPTIYRLFGDKDGLLEAVAEHVMATYVSAKAAVVEAASEQGVDPLVDLRAGWQAQIEFGLANPTLYRLLSEPGRVLTSPSAAAGRRVLEARITRVAETGRLRVSERRALDLISAAGNGAIQILLATPLADRDPGLADDLYEAVMRHVLLDTPERSDGDAKAAAVAFRAIAPGIAGLTPAEHGLLGEWLDRSIDSL